MREWRWQNQYINLIETKPEIIFSTKELTSEEVKARLISKIQGFSDVYCELGSGSGAHLVERASSAPHALWVGFENRFKRVFRTAEKAESLGLKNLIILQCNARRIREFFPEQKLKGIFVNFPDPWSKKRRWSKHRLLTSEYFSEMHPLICDQGFVAYKTDHEMCFKETLSILGDNSQFFVKEKSLDLYKSDYLSQNIASEFERLFVSKGYPIFYLRAEKK